MHVAHFRADLVAHIAGICTEIALYQLSLAYHPYGK